MEARGLDGMLNAIVKQYWHETLGVVLTRYKRRAAMLTIEDSSLSGSTLRLVVSLREGLCYANDQPGE